MALLEGHAPAASANALAGAAATRRPVIRSILPGDESNLGAFFRTLSPAARHRRFFGVMNEMPAALLAHFARPDGRNEVALIATTCEGSEERVVAEARYAVLENASRWAEFAIVVTDSAQGRGLGGRLLRTLLRRAAQNGIECVIGDVLPDNTAMLELARKFGFREGRSRADPRLVRVQ